MFSKEKETQFCRSRDEIKERLEYFKEILPKANGESEEVRKKISSLEEALTKEYNIFIKETGVLFLAMSEVKKTRSRNISKDNVEMKDYDSLFSESLNVLLTCLNKYNDKMARFSTFFVNSLRKKFSNVVREASLREKHTLQKRYCSDIPRERYSNPLSELQRREELEILYEGIEKLPNQARAYIVLRYLKNNGELRGLKEGSKMTERLKEIFEDPSYESSRTNKKAIEFLKEYMVSRKVA